MKLDVKVTDEVFAQIKQHFDITQIVELTAAIATYNRVAPLKEDPLPSLNTSQQIQR